MRQGQERPNQEMELPKRGANDLTALSASSWSAALRSSFPNRYTASSMVSSATMGNASHQNLFTGKAGEYYVAAQLLRLGWNASIAPVDAGIDILAHRHLPLGESQTLQCQVKTTLGNAYNAALTVEGLTRLWQQATNLIVVFWSSAKDVQAVVLPPRLVHMLTSGGFNAPEAPLKLDGDKVRLNVFKDGAEYFIRNKANCVTPMVDRYDLVECTDIDTSALPEYAAWSDEPETLVSFDLADPDAV